MKFLPGASFAQPQVGGSGRLPASEINELANAPRELTATVTARGALAPVLYGRRDVPGLVFASGKNGANLVIGYAWCIGEVDAIEAVYLNDEPAPAGAVLTHYRGTPTQGVDPTLAAAVAAYADTMRVDMPGGAKLGLCYSVLEIAPGTMGGFPRARAVIRGRRVLDPRTGLTAYSDNPALMLHDIITNPAFGLGRAVSGTAACADWCDSLLGGIPGAYRARAAIYIASGRQAEAYINLLCEYAECLRVDEGSTIKLVPDAPVDLAAAPVVGAGDVLAGSFSLTAESSLDTPTEVELQYTQPASVPAKAWALEPVVARLPGVTAGETQRIPTSLTMDGVFRAVEASNKALSRLNRMQGRLTASWTTLDMGVTHQRGDVVRVVLPARGIDLPVRIENVTLSAPGRYQVSASRYDASHYPDEAVLPGGDGFVPNGVIGMLVGTVLPPGWDLYGAANGRYIVGAGGALAPTATGGNNTLPAAALASSFDGAHTGSRDLPYPGGTTTDIGSYDRPGSPLTAGGHSHSVTVPAMDSNLPRRENPLVIKVGGDALEIPAEVRVFGLPNIRTTADKAIQFEGRLLMAGGAAQDAGTGTPTVAATASMAGSHTHTGSESNRYAELAAFGPVPRARYQVDDGYHTHTVSAQLQASVRRAQLCAFAAALPYAVRAGMIFMWAGSVASMPANFVLCNGANGSPDMRDRFAEFAGASPGAPAGDNTARTVLSFNTVGHSHLGGDRGFPAYDSIGHADTVYHTHTAQLDRAFTPAYYALAFIMYAPAG